MNDISDDTNILPHQSDKIEILQIGWDTWSEMCDFIRVGKLYDDKPEGTFLDENGRIAEGFHGDFSGNMGILFPTPYGLETGVAGDYVVKFKDGYSLLRSTPLIEGILINITKQGTPVNTRRVR